MLIQIRNKIIRLLERPTQSEGAERAKFYFARLSESAADVIICLAPNSRSWHSVVTRFSIHNWNENTVDLPYYNDDSLLASKGY